LADERKVPSSNQKVLSSGHLWDNKIRFSFCGRSDLKLGIVTASL